MTDDERQAALVAAYALPLEDPVARWRREADELAARRARAQEELRQAEREHLAAACQPAEIDPFLIDVIGAALADERKLMRAEIAEQVGQLRAEFNVMRSIDKERVVDLPALPRRRA